MSEQIREQISAFLDGELPSAETELLLKRLLRDAQLRESFGRYALIGEAVRGAKTMNLTRNFAAGVNGAIDGEPVNGAGKLPATRKPYWWRPLAGAAIAAGVAAVAVFALQHRANTPTVAAVTAQPAPIAKSSESISYTVPTATGPAPETVPGGARLPGARLTNYVFAHSQYPTLLGQRDVLTDLIVEVDQPTPEANASSAR
jgi:negative regulator of sigma E activity